MSDESLSRRAFVGVSAAIAVTRFEKSHSAPIARHTAPSTPPPQGLLDDLTIVDLQTGMQSGKYTSRMLVEQYAARIGALDQKGPML
jgi:hypothetical protein